MMTLKEFVKETLSQITEATAEFATKTGGNLNPILSLNSAAGAEQGMFRTSDGTNVIAVDFDVAISASDETTGDAKGGAKVLGVLDVGGGVEKTVASSTVSRVRFRLPLEMPVDGGQAELKARRDVLQRRVRDGNRDNWMGS